MVANPGTEAVKLPFLAYVYNYICEVEVGIHGCIEDLYGGSTVCINGGLDGEE